MKHRMPGWYLIPLLVAVLAVIPGCDEPEEAPLPEVTGVTVAQGPESPQNPGTVDTIIVSWDGSKDSRVEGYAIYRAEQGLGAIASEKSEYELQAITLATQYVDDEVRTSVRYPMMQYFYRVSVIGPDTMQGPMSAEVSIEFSGTVQS